MEMAASVSYGCSQAESYVWCVCESEGGKLHVSTGQRTAEGFGVPVGKDGAPRTENTSNNKGEGEDGRGSKRESRVRAGCCSGDPGEEDVGFSQKHPDKRV